MNRPRAHHSFVAAFQGMKPLVCTAIFVLGCGLAVCHGEAPARPVAKIAEQSTQQKASLPQAAATVKVESKTSSETLPNLIPNPGMEDGPTNAPNYFWHLNNWPSNEVESAWDSQNPHSGKYSQRITLKRIINKPDLQWNTPPLPVHAGMSLKLSFWVRGRSNARPLTVELRKAQAPWTTFWSTQFTMADQWTQQNFTATLPPTTDPKDTVLMFHLHDEETVWFDDVSLSEMPKVDERAPMQGNLIANGSFEAGIDRWYGCFRHNGVGGYVKNEIADGRNIDANITSIPAADAPSGQRVLHFPIFEDCATSLTSAYFPLRYHVPITISFQLKTSKPNARFDVSLGCGKVPAITMISKAFASPNTKWNTYTFAATPEPSSSGTYFLEIYTSTPGEYDLDSVCVNEGTEPLVLEKARRFNAGIEPCDASHPANIFYPNEDATFQVRLENASPSATTIQLRGRVLDVWNRTVFSFPLQVTTTDQGYGTAPFFLPTNLYGGFRCELRRPEVSDAALPDAELIYNVAPKLPAPSEVKNSYFGGHVRLTPYNLLIAQRAGMYWLRLHPPMPTKWMVVESRKGEYEFQLEGVKRAHDMGFKILGSFDTTPSFYAMAGLTEHKEGGFGHTAAPGDWAAYRRYVIATAKAFGPYIDHWEVWNEPDGSGFLEVPKEEDRVKIYLNILHNTRQAFDEGHIKDPIVAPAFSTIHNTKFRQILTAGSRDLDMVSFHYYFETADVNEVKPTFADEMAFIRSLPNHDGKTPEIWMSEGGVWGNGSDTWMKTSGKPISDGTTILEATNTLVRIATAFKAMGATKHIHYAEFAHPSGGLVYRDECAGLIDVNGIPHPALTAHATMVRFLDSAKSVKLDVQSIKRARPIVARFEREKQSIIVAWSRQPVELGSLNNVPLTDCQGFDMMGNPIQLTATTKLSIDPIYILGPKN